LELKNIPFNLENLIMVKIYALFFTTLSNLAYVRKRNALENIFFPLGQ
jgi:hypothetical protein